MACSKVQNNCVASIENIENISTSRAKASVCVHWRAPKEARPPGSCTHFSRCPTGTGVDSSGADGETSVRIRVHRSERHKNHQVRIMGLLEFQISLLSFFLSLLYVRDIRYDEHLFT